MHLNGISLDHPCLHVHRLSVKTFKYKPVNGFWCVQSVKCPLNYPKIRLTSSNWHHLPSGGDDRPTLSRLPLRSHWVLGLPSAVRLPSGWIWGGPSSSSRLCPIFTSQNQGGAEWRYPQEEGQESRVGRQAENCIMASTWWDLPFLSRERGSLMFNQMRPFLLEQNGAFCILHRTRTL